jgi:hypothetical protein
METGIKERLAYKRKLKFIIEINRVKHRIYCNFKTTPRIKN